ncbi:exosortase A [Sphingobium amiense]|nr:EpsI domain-containing exosortase [Sphingobium amiense]
MREEALPLRSAPLPMAGEWRAHLATLGIVAFAIMALFFADVRSMVTIWWTASTFGHCLFVPLLIGWLVQQRLPGLRKLEPSVWLPGLLWLGGGALLWLLGAAAGVALFRHAALVLMLQGATVALLGRAVSRALLFPLFYGFFMVPFGEEMVPPLQLVTARLAMVMLDMVDVPAHLEGIFITTPTGYFEVAEACSGAKFVIAMAAYGVLVCNVCFKSWTRRALFLAGALGLSVLANGVRAFATILVAHLTSVDAAVGFDHVVYGWVFFAIVMVLVMAAAWPFFDRKPGDPWFDPKALKEVRRATVNPLMAGGMALALVAAAPLWLAVSSAAADPLPTELRLPQVAGWDRTDLRPAYPWKPRFDGADHLVMGRYRNADRRIVDVAIATFDRQEEGRELVGFAQGAADPDSQWVWSSPAPAPQNGLGEQITAPGPVVRHVVSFFGIGGGALTGSKAEVKLATLKTRLSGGDQRAVAILVSAEVGEGRAADKAIADFIHDSGDMQLLADRSIGIR